MFELQVEPLLGPLAEIWPEKSIREMPYKELRSVMAESPEEWRAEALVAASIDVPLEDILNLPGRYASAVASLIATVTRMHGLGIENAPPVNGTDVQQGEAAEAPKH